MPYVEDKAYKRDQRYIRATFWAAYLLAVLSAATAVLHWAHMREHWQQREAPRDMQNLAP